MQAKRMHSMKDMPTETTLQNADEVIIKQSLNGNPVMCDPSTIEHSIYNNHEESCHPISELEIDRNEQVTKDIENRISSKSMLNVSDEELVNNYYVFVKQNGKSVCCKQNVDDLQIDFMIVEDAKLPYNCLRVSYV